MLAAMFDTLEKSKKDLNEGDDNRENLLITIFILARNAMISAAGSLTKFLATQKTITKFQKKLQTNGLSFCKSCKNTTHTVLVKQQH